MRAPQVTRHASIFKLTELMCMWQELEYRIDVCRVTRCACIEHL